MCHLSDSFKAEVLAQYPPGGAHLVLASLVVLLRAAHFMDGAHIRVAVYREVYYRSYVLLKYCGF